MLNLTRSRKSLISAYCRHCDAWIEMTLALDFDSPKTVRTCHCVGMTCLRDSGTNSSGCSRLPKLWKIHLFVLPRKGLQRQWCFFEGIVSFLSHQIFPEPGAKMRKCLQPQIWYSAIAKHSRHCCHMFFPFGVFGSNRRRRHNDLGVFIFELWPKAL